MSTIAIGLDDFRALARSAPWLWRSFTAVVTAAGGDPVDFGREPIRVTTNRDGALEATRLDGEVLKSERATPGEWPDRDALLAEATRRPDGLVTHRVDSPPDLDCVLIQSYQWVAITDPRELVESAWSGEASDALIEDLRVEVIDGRETWCATVTPAQDYDPRCSCCALMTGTVSLAIDQIGDWEHRARGASTRFAVGLDRQTGVVSHLRHLDGKTAGEGWDIRIESVAPH
ncbi:hypothetical protein GCM10027030_19990 [Luteococcus sediminum]